MLGCLGRLSAEAYTACGALCAYPANAVHGWEPEIGWSLTDESVTCRRCQRALKWFTVEASFGRVRFGVAARDEEDAKDRFIDAALKDPDILLKGLEFERIDPVS